MSPKPGPGSKDIYIMIPVAFQTSGDKGNYTINCVKKSNYTLRRKLS